MINAIRNAINNGTCVRMEISIAENMGMVLNFFPKSVDVGTENIIVYASGDNTFELPAAGATFNADLEQWEITNGDTFIIVTF